jgi:hypothetical protein
MLMIRRLIGSFIPHGDKNNDRIPFKDLNVSRIAHHEYREECTVKKRG